MFTKHGLFQIPLASPELEAAFAGQLICKWVDRFAVVPEDGLMAMIAKAYMRQAQRES